MSKVILFALFSGFAIYGSAQTDLLLADFQSGIPSNFTIIDNDGFTPASQVSEYTSAWISKADPEDAANLTASSTSYFSPVGKADRWMITNSLTLGAYGNFVSWKAKSHDASFTDGYRVLVSTTGTQVADFIDTIGQIQAEYSEWTMRSIDLSAEGYNNQTVYLAFVNITNDGFKLYMDSIHVWMEDPVGINEAQDFQLSVYPNPFANSIKISTDLVVQKIELVDFNGRILLEKVGSDEIDTTPVSSGIFFLRIYSDQGLVVRRLIKN